MNNHGIRFERQRYSVINEHGKFEERYASTATTRCACGLNTGPIPAEQADRIAEEHIDVTGLPDPLRELRQFLKRTG